MHVNVFMAAVIPKTGTAKPEGIINSFSELPSLLEKLGY